MKPTSLPTIVAQYRLLHISELLYFFIITGIEAATLRLGVHY